MTDRIPSIDLDYLRSILERLLAIPSPSGMTDEIVVAVTAELDALELAPFRALCPEAPAVMAAALAWAPLCASSWPT